MIKHEFSKFLENSFKHNTGERTKWNKIGSKDMFTYVKSLFLKSHVNLLIVSFTKELEFLIFIMHYHWYFLPRVIKTL